MIELLNEVDSQVEVAPYWNVNEDTKELEDKFAE